MRSVTGTPTVRYATTLARRARLDQRLREQRLRDLAAQGEDPLRLGLERDDLAGHALGRVVVLRHEVDVVADGGERRGGGLADGGDLRGGGDLGAVREEHVDRGGAGDGEPVELARRELRERVVEGCLVVRRCEVDQGRDDGDRPLCAQVAATPSPHGPPRGTARASL
jgi:hypothetical protein